MVEEYLVNSKDSMISDLLRIGISKEDLDKRVKLKGAIK